MSLESTLLKTEDKEDLSILIIKKCLNQFNKFGEILNSNTIIEDFINKKHPNLLLQADVLTIKKWIYRYSFQYITINKIKDINSNGIITLEFRKGIYELILNYEKEYIKDIEDKLRS